MQGQVKRNAKWRRKHRKHANFLAYRSTARTFVRHYASDNDMKMLNEIFKESREQ